MIKFLAEKIQKLLTVHEPKGNSSFGFLFPTLINEQLKLALGVDIRF